MMNYASRQVVCPKLRAYGAGSVLALAIFLTSSCGAPRADGADDPFKRTIRWIINNGMPGFATLFPGLPGLFASATGVSTDETGLPGTPTNLDGSIVNASQPDLAALLTDARTLSAQGFSEARRMEAVFQSVFDPVLSVASQKSLFSALSGPSSSNNIATENWSDAHAMPEVATLFEDLLDLTQFVVALDEGNGVPARLIFSKGQTDDLVHLVGAWSDASGGGYMTGFDLAFGITDDETMEFSALVAPKVTGAAVSTWTSQSCRDDVWQFTARLSQGSSGAEILSRECASTANRVNALSVGRTGDALSIGGAFVQNFSDAKSGSLRDFLGSRHGFVLQAALSASDASGNSSGVAAAAAVLRERDFSTNATDAVNRFGVGQLLVDFVLAKYWEPKRDAVSGGFIPSASDLKNVAYYSCNAPGVASAIQGSVSGVGALCEGQSLDAESLVQTMVGLKNQLSSLSIAESIKDEINQIVSILEIRNGIFLQSGSSVTYKTPPTEVLKSLDSARSQLAIPVVGDSAWSTQTGLKTFTKAELDAPIYSASTAAVAKHMNSQCNSLLQDALTKIGKPISQCAN